LLLACKWLQSDVMRGQPQSAMWIIVISDDCHM
jgi:hypothetical protein